MQNRRTKGTLILAAVLLLGLLPLVNLARPAKPSEQAVSQAAVGTPLALEGASPPPVLAGEGTPPVLTAASQATPAQPELHIADVRGGVNTDPYGDYLLVVYVAVHDAYHVPLGQVKVEASIWWPGGGPVSRMRITRPANGTARFHWGSKVAGHWKLCVDSLSRDGYLYHPDAGEVSACAEWTN